MMTLQVAEPVLGTRGDLDATLEALRRDRAVEIPGRGRSSIDPFAVTNGAGDVLEAAAWASPAGAVIEVGCASALSTLHIARGRWRAGHLDEHEFHVADPEQAAWGNLGRLSIARAGLEARITLHEHRADQVMPRLADRGLEAGIVFLDGFHQLDYVMLEAFYADRMLRVGGVLALHDLWMPALQHFASFWCANRSYEPVTISRSEGLCRAPVLQAAPCTSAKRQIGDPAAALPYFRERLAEYVDWSVLLLRKRSADARRWDEFHPYM